MMFVSALISCTRTIAILRPFKAQEFSVWGVLSAVVLWFVFCMIVSYVYLTWVWAGFSQVQEGALGLGFVLPGIGHEQANVIWRVLIFIIPNGILLLCVSCAQGTGLKGLMKESGIMATQTARNNRRRASQKSLVTLILTLIQFCPLLLMHILAMFEGIIQLDISFLFTIVNLFLIPLINVIAHVIISGAFQSFVLRGCTK